MNCLVFKEKRETFVIVKGRTSSASISIQRVRDREPAAVDRSQLKK